MRQSPIDHIKERLARTTRESPPQVKRICSVEARTAPLAALVVGHDRQSESRGALDVAMNLADRCSASLHVVHAVSLGDYPIDPDIGDWEAYARERLAEEQAEVTEALRDHTTGWSYHVGRGDPAWLLIRVAEEHNALMVIVGSRGEGIRASFGWLMEPPVSHRLNQDARCPVLVVNHPRVVRGTAGLCRH